MVNPGALVRTSDYAGTQKKKKKKGQMENASAQTSLICTDQPLLPMQVITMRGETGASFEGA